MKVSLNRAPHALLGKTWYWSRSLCSLKKHDIIFPGFPKVGSSWVRMVIWHLYTIKTSGQTSPLTFDKLDAQMPELGNPACWSPWPFGALPRMLKTHKRYLPFYKNRRIVLMVRDPLSTIASLSAYVSGTTDYAYEGSLDDLVSDPQFGLERLMSYYQDWRPRASWVLKYEDLRSDPDYHFSEFFRFIGVEHSPDELKEALHYSSMEMTRQAQQKSSPEYKDRYEDGFLFARTGNIRSEPNEFSDKSMALYRDLRVKYAFDLYSL